MFGLFSKPNESVCSPVDGTCIPMEEVKDEVFSSKMLGDGFAVVPSSGTVCAPIDGELTMLAETCHAFGMRTKSGKELLVHIGLDTVALNGEGFKVLSEQGKKVKAGEPIVEFDQKLMADKNIDTTTMIILTAGFSAPDLSAVYQKQVKAGQVLIQ